MKTTYQQRKEDARQKVIDWQEDSFSGENPDPMSYGELADYQAHFEKLGKRYGLICEFKENGII